MELFLQIERIKFLNQLLLQENTGPPEALAARLGISRSKLYAILEELRDIGLEIQYSRRRQTFYFQEGSRLQLEVHIRIIKKNRASA
ncbi:helix-turn-helix domain-containing protein [Nitritalea halalkaliphila]|nr:HTH domain-containing protein [Nitritalea halalkaliphila]